MPKTKNNNVSGIIYLIFFFSKLTFIAQIKETINIVTTANTINLIFTNKIERQKTKIQSKKNNGKLKLLKYFFLFFDLKNTRKTSLPYHNCFLKKVINVSAKPK